MSELSNVRYPGWEPQYKAAMLELDYIKLKERLQGAHLAISERLRILSQDHFASPEERSAIADALNGLAMLKREMKRNLKQSKSDGDGRT
jgi:hypothetical protein